jgi:hypothetical protein
MEHVARRRTPSAASAYGSRMTPTPRSDDRCMPLRPAMSSRAVPRSNGRYRGIGVQSSNVGRYPLPTILGRHHPKPTKDARGNKRKIERRRRVGTTHLRVEFSSLLILHLIRYDGFEELQRGAFSASGKGEQGEGTHHTSKDGDGRSQRTTEPMQIHPRGRA